MFDDRKLFVGNLPPQVTVADLYKHFQAFGTVELVSMLKQKSISGCKCSFVVMSTVQEALQCMDKSMNDPEFKAIVGWPQFPIAVRWANQHRSSDVEAQCYTDASNPINASVAFGQDRTNVFATPTGKEAVHVDGEIKLFVGNLPPNVSQLAVTEVFHVFGGLVEVFVFRRPSMRDQNSRCAFVRFDNDQSAYQAMAHLDGKVALGRQLIVRLANARPGPSQE
jgi:RNA recognition motif-containing protein